MGTNGFREDELISRKLNGQTRVFPVVGGRLRLAHEENQNLNLQTEMVYNGPRKLDSRLRWKSRPC